MRLVGYVRVSRVAGREGDSFISPDVQREQIVALAKARGHKIVEWIEDLDESGGKWERPGFQRMLAMVESGEADGVAVAKLDRFARSLSDALRAIERINAAAGELVSVADNFDTTTPMGRAMLQISLVFAELERARQRDGFRVAKTRAIERGIHISTLVPVGYTRGQDRRLIPDKQAARAIREVFLRRGRGDSWAELARFLDTKLPRERGAWTRQTVAKLVSNRAYIGEAHQGAIVKPQAHPAIVSRAEWEAAQPRAGKAVTRSGSLLSGILRCGSCGRPMSRVSSFDYGCRARRSDGVCSEPVVIRIDRADTFVSERFLDWASAQHVEYMASPRSDDVANALARLEGAETELVAYRDANLVSVIGRDPYVEGLRERAEAVDVARRALADAQTASVTHIGHFNAPALWPELSTAERRTLIASVIDAVDVSPGDSRGASRPASDRLRLVWHVDTPKDKPRLASA